MASRHAPQRRSTGLARFALGVISADAAGIVLLGQLGREQQLLDQFNALLPLLLPSLALALVMAVIMRDRICMVITTLGLAVGGYQLATNTLTALHTVPLAEGKTITVLTLSTYHSNPAPSEIARIVREEAPDIALLQETSGTAKDAVESVLPHFHRVKSCKHEHCSLMILSRWPLRTVRIENRTPGIHTDLFAAQVDSPHGTFRVMNVHLDRPYHDRAPEQLAETAKLARQDPTIPLIVGGDFNTGTGTFGLARFERESSLRRVDGIIPTYPANQAIPAFSGIDHIFVNAHWSKLGCHRTDAGGSDHFGIACKVKLTPAP